MSDRFRDLEMSRHSARKDAVLLATVSGFEAIDRPSHHEQRQFQDLFLPLFETAGPETRRTVSAILSRCRHVPHDIALTIARQPIDVAAPFLVHSDALDEEILLDLIATSSLQHARPIARRTHLSSAVQAALFSLSDPQVTRSLRLRGFQPCETCATDDDGNDALRSRLRSLVMRDGPSSPSTPLRPAPDVEDRLIRHAREGDVQYFTTALADALAASFQLAERIMLDVSGRQLAETLLVLGLRYTTIVQALEAFFPHLSEESVAGRRSLLLLRGCDFVEAVERVAAWQRADHITRGDMRHEPVMAETARKKPSQPATGTGNPRYERRPLKRA